MHLFFRLWSMKEALIKALGSGFSLNPFGFEVPGPMRARRPFELAYFASPTAGPTNGGSWIWESRALQPRSHLWDADVGGDEHGDTS